MESNEQKPLEVVSEQPVASSGSKRIFIGVVIVILIIVLGYSFFAKKGFVDFDGDDDFVRKTTSTAPVQVSSASYKDGQYTADGAYESPAGAEDITVTITLKENVITDATVIGKATASKSIRYQGQFIDGFKALVIGKNINEVNLTKVSGSSLTPEGFNDALAKIKAQAKV